MSVSTIALRNVDLKDESDVRAYWTLATEAVADRPYAMTLPWPTARHFITSPRTDAAMTYLMATDGDRVVGTAQLFAPLLDNTHVAEAMVNVAPERRREGIGGRLLAVLEERARGLGRRLLAGIAFAPPGEDSPAVIFARSHGMRVVAEDGMKAVDLQATKDSWSAMAAAVAAEHADYRLVTTWEPLPDELMGGYCALNTAFMTLAPTGDADVEDEHWDAARVRERESRSIPAGRHDLFTLALAPDGQAVALTELFINENAPHKAIQGGTLVLPGHRGHALGLAVKLANQTALLERFPAVEFATTGNADINVHMNAINDRLGYRLVERGVEFERDL